MRTTFKNRSSLLFAAVAGLSLSLAACAGEADDDADEDSAAELDDAMMANDAPTDGEIAEAVPGVEDVDTEGETPNTAELDEDENIETADVGDDANDD